MLVQVSQLTSSETNAVLYDDVLTFTTTLVVPNKKYTDGGRPTLTSIAMFVYWCRETFLSTG